MCNSPIIPQVWKSLTDEWKGVVVCHVPVENVELVHLHEVKVVQQDFFGQKVPGRVHHDPPVGVPRLIFDVGRVYQVL